MVAMSVWLKVDIPGDMVGKGNGPWLRPSSATGNRPNGCMGCSRWLLWKMRRRLDEPSAAGALQTVRI